jgi:hypothetical protein
LKELNISIARVEIRSEKDRVDKFIAGQKDEMTRAKIKKEDLETVDQAMRKACIQEERIEK